MAEPNPPIARNPRSMSVRTAVGEPGERLLEEGGRNRLAR
jgi:hypothetical protein